MDEAHSSQTGESAQNLRKVLAATNLEEAEKEEASAAEDDPEEEIVKAINARGPQKNLSFFAFTATPKHKTLELFGTPGVDGKPEPFHLYSMRQAIEEGSSSTCSRTTRPTRPTTSWRRPSRTTPS